MDNSGSWEPIKQSMKFITFAESLRKLGSHGTFDSQPLMCLNSTLGKVDLFSIILALNARVSAASAALIGFHCTRNRDSH